MLTKVLVFVTFAVFSHCVRLDFPPHFKFGAATSNYQVEGGWNASDKSPSVWDTFVHQHSSLIADHSTGDVACDSYHLWERDIEMTAELNLDYYRFSLSWTRILPTGFSNRISEDGIRYYNNLIDGLLAKGIEPVVTMYHWDLPQNLQDLGGWTNPLIAEWFGDFARVVFTHFGDRVKTWLTINEPLVVCDVVFNSGAMGIPIQDDSVYQYICTKNLLIAHATVYRMYDTDFRHLQNGRVSIANHFVWFEPVTEEDAELAELANEYNLGRYSHPIFSKEGGWPASFEKVVAQNSADEGYPRSRLPALTQDETDFIKGTYDFFSMNHYGARKIRKLLPGEVSERWDLLALYDLKDSKLEFGDDWYETSVGWLRIYRESTRLTLSWLKSHYGDLEYFISETGLPYTDVTNLDDVVRIKYIQEQLSQILLSIYEDGVNVTGYTYWSLMDNFEWNSGYNERFGLYKVDFDDPARTRTPRSSAKYYSSVIGKRSLDQLYV